MTTTRIGAGRAALAALLPAALLLAGCTAALGTASEPPTAGTWTGTEDGAQACVVADTTEGWEAAGEWMQDWTNSINEWSYCRLVDFSTGEDPVDVQFLPGDAYDSLEGVVERDGVKVIEAGGRIVEAWMVAGGPRYEGDFLMATIGVRQTTGRFTDEELIAFLTAVAIEHENHDWRWFKRDGVFLEELAGETEGDATGDPDGTRPEIEYDSALRAVHLEGTVESTGSRFAIEVTAEDVEEAAMPAATMIYCIGGIEDQSTGVITSGQYLVSAMDVRITDGLRMASLEAVERVDGPGTYAAELDLSEADGDSFALTGSITIDEGMRSGAFEMDADGTLVWGGWECRV